MTHNVFTDYQVGTKVLSANNSQPGTVIEVSRVGWDAFKDYFVVEWLRHPGKTRKYYRSVARNQEFGGFPTIVERFDWEQEEEEDWEKELLGAGDLTKEPTNEELTEAARPEVVFVDALSNARESAQDALRKSVVPSGENSVGIDINIFLAALSANGWVYVGAN